MNLLKKVKGKYINWLWNRSTPARRGKLLYEKKVPGPKKIGTGCEIYINYTDFGSEPYLIEIGNNVRITKGVMFCTHDGGMWVVRKNGMLKDADYFGKIKIEDNVHIGWNTIIMPNVTIGHDSIIGCGAVVTHDIPPMSIAVGVPAKVIRSLDEYCEKYRPLVDYTSSLSRDEKYQYLSKKYKGE